MRWILIPGWSIAPSARGCPSQFHTIQGSFVSQSPVFIITIFTIPQTVFVLPAGTIKIYQWTTVTIPQWLSFIESSPISSSRSKRSSSQRNFISSLIIGVRLCSSTLMIAYEAKIDRRRLSNNNDERYLREARCRGLLTVSHAKSVVSRGTRSTEEEEGLLPGRTSSKTEKKVRSKVGFWIRAGWWSSSLCLRAQAELRPSPARSFPADSSSLFGSCVPIPPRTSFSFGRSSLLDGANQWWPRRSFKRETLLFESKQCMWGNPCESFQSVAYLEGFLQIFLIIDFKYIFWYYFLFSHFSQKNF